MLLPESIRFRLPVTSNDLETTHHQAVGAEILLLKPTPPPPSTLYNSFCRVT